MKPFCGKCYFHYNDKSCSHEIVRRPYTRKDSWYSEGKIIYGYYHGCCKIMNQNNDCDYYKKRNIFNIFSMICRNVHDFSLNGHVVGKTVRNVKRSVELIRLKRENKDKLMLQEAIKQL